MHKRANAVYLLAAFSLLHLGRSPEDAFRPFQSLSPPLAPWHDASPTVDTFHLTTLDVLRGIAKARDCHFFSHDAFEIDEYEHYERVENGDMNWIVEGRFLAFAGPHDVRASTAEGYHTTAVEDLVPYFKAKGVTTVVRLNKKYYNEKRFTHAGIAHHDMYYLDGSNPPDHILQRFLTIAESTPGAIAVHCKAGLGRTGTCIGAYMMKHYRFSAREVIGWMRVCRPGSVIGPQQQYMEEIQSRMWSEGEAFRRIKDLPPPVVGTLLYQAQCGRSATTSPGQKRSQSPSEMIEGLTIGGGGSTPAADVASTVFSSGGRAQAPSPADESTGGSTVAGEAGGVGTASPPSRSSAGGASSTSWGLMGRSTRSVVGGSSDDSALVTGATGSASPTPPLAHAAAPTTPSATAGRRSASGSVSSSAPGAYASPGSSPTAQSYLARKPAEAATSSARFGATAASLQAPTVGGSSQRSVLSSPMLAVSAYPSAPALTSMGSQGDMLRSAKSRSPQVGLGMGSPSVALGLRNAGSGVVSPSVRSPGFSQPGDASGGGASGRGVSTPTAAASAGASPTASATSSRYSLRGR